MGKVLRAVLLQIHTTYIPTPHTLPQTQTHSQTRSQRQSQAQIQTQTQVIAPTTNTNTNTDITTTTLITDKETLTYHRPQKHKTHLHGSWKSKTFCGHTGQPQSNQSFASIKTNKTSGDQTQVASCPLKRNNNRGFRNTDTIAIRKRKRADRRRLARRTKRKKRQTQNNRHQITVRQQKTKGEH